MCPKYFLLYEFCRSKTAEDYNISNIPTWDIVPNLLRLAYRLDDVRIKFGDSVFVSSGYRCDELNALVGGNQLSYHRFGRAADIYAKDLNALFKVVKTFNWIECYINYEKNYIHVAL